MTSGLLELDVYYKTLNTLSISETKKMTVNGGGRQDCQVLDRKSEVVSPTINKPQRFKEGPDQSICLLGYCIFITKFYGSQDTNKAL